MWYTWQVAIRERVLSLVGGLDIDRYYIGYMPKDRQYPYIYSPLESGQERHTLGVYKPMYVFDWRISVWCDMRRGGPQKVEEVFDVVKDGLVWDLLDLGASFTHVKMLPDIVTPIRQDVEDESVFFQTVIYSAQVDKN